MMTQTRKTAALLLLLAMGTATGCASPPYLGNTSKGFWSDAYAPVSPNDAYYKAEPHLEATWKARCQEVHQQDGWCKKPPLDHMVQKGDYYYITRTSMTYEKKSEYLKYAVKVNKDTGEVIPLN